MQRWGVITTETGRGSLAGLPALLDLLGRQPTADSVAEAIVTGPAALFGAKYSMVMVLDGDRLRLIGSYGYSADDLAGFEVIPLAADLPLSQAVRDGQAIVSISPDLIDEFEGLAAHRERWARFEAERRLGSLAVVPVAALGVAIGAYVIACADEWLWRPRDLTLLESVADALALWMLHPTSGVAAGSSSESGAGANMGVRLTPRQCAILQLVSEGHTTEAIGATLGYSGSTVKQDIQRAMRALDVPTREDAVARARELGLCHGASS